MNTLTLSVYSNNKLDIKYEKIPYQEKQTFIYFEIDKTKYFLSKDINSFKYQTQEEKVNMDFKNKKVTITLIPNNYTLNIKINKFEYEKDKNTYKITYVLDSEPDVTRKLLLILNKGE